jgi:hypothetical protein
LFQYSGQRAGDYSIDRDSETQSNFSAQGADLFCHTIQSETALKVVAKPQPSSLKNPFTAFLSFGKTTEQLLLKETSRFTFNSQNLATRFGATDIIFPFHYFW